MATKQILYLQEGENPPEKLPRGCVYIIDGTKKSEYILHISEGTECHILRIGFTDVSTKICAEIEPNGVCTFDGIFLGDTTNVEVEGNVDGNNAFGKIEILCLAREKSTMKIRANMSVSPGIQGFSAYVRQQNILLGEDAKIQGIPTLHVASKEGKAGHSCTVSRIPEEHIFYLTSHGIDRENADMLLLEGLIKKRFQCFSDLDIAESLQEKIIQSLFR